MKTDCIASFTLHAVSNPKLVGTSLHFKSPSMVLGHPMTRVFKFLLLYNPKLNKQQLKKQEHLHIQQQQSFTPLDEVNYMDHTTPSGMVKHRSELLMNIYFLSHTYMQTNLYKRWTVKRPLMVNHKLTNKYNYTCQFIFIFFAE